MRETRTIRHRETGKVVAHGLTVGFTLFYLTEMERRGMDLTKYTVARDFQYSGQLATPADKFIAQERDYVLINAIED